MQQLKIMNYINIFYFRSDEIELKCFSLFFQRILQTRNLIKNILIKQNLIENYFLIMSYIKI